MATKQEWKARAKDAEAEVAALTKLIDPEFGWREMKAEWDATSGEFQARMVGGKEGTVHPAGKVLMAMAASLLGAYPDAPNYVCQTIEYKPAGEVDAEAIVEIAACRSRWQTPSELRKRAEERVAELEAELAEMKETP